MKTSRLLQFACAALLAIAGLPGSAGVTPTGTGIWVLPNTVDPTTLDVEGGNFVLVPLSPKAIDTSAGVKISLPEPLSHSTGTRFSDGENPRNIPVVGRTAIITAAEIQAAVAEGVQEIVVTFAGDGVVAVGQLVLTQADPTHATAYNF